MSGFDDIVSQFLTGGDKPNDGSFEDLVREFGVSMGDTEKMRQMLHSLGYTDAQLEDANEMARIAQDFLVAMPDETRKNIMNMVIQALSILEFRDVPPDIQGFLETAHGAPGEPAGPQDTDPKDET
ncbi:MAG: hypothetical protein WBJ25_05365 [Bacillota bacterium]|jgi:hypothetical protein